MPGLAFVAALALSAGPPALPTHQRPPPRGVQGTGLKMLGGTLQALSLGAGITGIFLSGTPGKALTSLSTVPFAHGAGLVIMGEWLDGRHRGWYDPRDLVARVRTSRRVGWSLLGVGLGLFAGTGIVHLVWPHDLSSCADEGCAVPYPGAFAAVESGLLLGQLMISAGANALTWSYAYAEARGRRLELTPTLGGLSMRF